MIPKARLMATTSSTTASNKSMVVEKPSQEPLRCPRCDSSNTKFCYYNNYSLSQPRHFCKACKRYWTRGGTLRNVPVGGSCRKNNRVKHRQPPSNGGGDAVAKAAASAGNPSFLRPRLDLPHSSSISNSSLLYSLSSAANNMNTALEFSFPFSGLSSTKVSSDNNSSGLFDMNLHHVTDLGIGFSSSSGLVENHLEFSNGFKNFIQDHSNSNNPPSSLSSSPVFNNPILFGSSSAFSPSTSTTMASLLASTIQQQQKFANNGDLKDIETRSSNLHRSLVPSYHEEKSTQENESGWNSNPNLNTNQYHIPQINPSDANSSLLWNPSNVNSAWFDPSNSNMGSSVPSLIN